MEKLVEKLLRKAKRVAKVLGKDEIEVLNINVDSNNTNHHLCQWVIQA